MARLGGGSTALGGLKSSGAATEGALLVDLVKYFKQHLGRNHSLGRRGFRRRLRQDAGGWFRRGGRRQERARRRRLLGLENNGRGLRQRHRNGQNNPVGENARRRGKAQGSRTTSGSRARARRSGVRHAQSSDEDKGQTLPVPEQALLHGSDLIVSQNSYPEVYRRFGERTLIMRGAQVPPGF